VTGRTAEIYSACISRINCDIHGTKNTTRNHWREIEANAQVPFVESLFSCGINDARHPLEGHGIFGASLGRKHGRFFDDDEPILLDEQSGTCVMLISSFLPYKRPCRRFLLWMGDNELVDKACSGVSCIVPCFSPLVSCLRQCTTISFLASNKACTSK
jgi:hypothetical protein